jgi:hypothetical protein
MQFIFMNERIRSKNPKKPVIVCQAEGGTREANEFTLRIGDVVIGRVVYSKDGLDVCDTHEVKAWVELNDNVDVVAGRVERPVAQAKGPNQKVRFVG